MRVCQLEIATLPSAVFGEKTKRTPTAEIASTIIRSEVKYQVCCVIALLLKQKLLVILRQVI